MLFHSCVWRSNQSILKEINLIIHWKDWCWSWSSNSLATWCEKPTHSKRPRCWERLRAGEEGDYKGWDGWMASPMQRAWANPARFEQKKVVDRRISRMGRRRRTQHAGNLDISHHGLPSSTRLMSLWSWSLLVKVGPPKWCAPSNSSFSFSQLHLLSSRLWDKSPRLSRAQSLTLGNSQDNRGRSWGKR